MLLGLRGERGLRAPLLPARDGGGAGGPPLQALGAELRHRGRGQHPPLQGRVPAAPCGDGLYHLVLRRGLARRGGAAYPGGGAVPAEVRGLRPGRGAGPAADGLSFHPAQEKGIRHPAGPGLPGGAGEKRPAAAPAGPGGARRDPGRGRRRALHRADGGAESGGVCGPGPAGGRLHPPLGGAGGALGEPGDPDGHGAADPAAGGKEAAPGPIAGFRPAAGKGGKKHCGGGWR